MPYTEGVDTVLKARGAVYQASLTINAEKVTQGGSVTFGGSVALPAQGKQWPYIR
jgi:hypothetical protein